MYWRLLDSNKKILRYHKCPNILNLFLFEIAPVGENHASSTINSGSHPSSQNRSSGAPVTGGTTATMTVTSPAWSGTSWTGGMAYGCTAALKTTGDGGKPIHNLG